MQHGTWPFPVSEELIPFHWKKEELTLHDGCIPWGKCVIIPQKLQSRLLYEVHIGHIGVCRMNALAKSFIWWPGLDKAIEKMAAHCKPCKTMIAMSIPVAQHARQLPNGPWERVHVDYGELNNHHFVNFITTQNNKQGNQ